MRNRLAARLARLGAALAAVAALALLGACADIAASLPARPTPVPTLPRLPSVTPVTPRPTAPLTATPTATPATPTAVALTGTVTTGANVRAGPGVEFAIVGVLGPGDEVRLEGRREEWYQISTPDGLEGWMSGVVLAIDPAINAAVPEAIQ
jgi:hypothetical protein